MPDSTTATSTAWGQHRADATRLHPRIAWHLLTNAQLDCLYLNDSAFGTMTVPQREIAARYGVTCSVVTRHKQAAWRRLGVAGRDAALAPDDYVVPEERIGCQECDTPWLPCFDCLDKVFFHCTAVFINVGIHRRQVSPERAAAAAELPNAYEIDAPAHGRTEHLIKNSDYRDTSAPDTY